VAKGKKHWKQPSWTQEQKDKLMKLAETRGVTYQIAKIVRKSVADCHIMYRLLKENASLGKLTVVVEDGIRITKCPPGYARGVYPQRSVGHKP
jgi:hypothetical protein